MLKTLVKETKLRLEHMNLELLFRLLVEEDYLSYECLRLLEVRQPACPKSGGLQGDGLIFLLLKVGLGGLSSGESLSPSLGWSLRVTR
jgi:hypothetical protein